VAAHLLAGAQGTEVLDRLGYGFAIQLHLDATGILTVDVDVEEHRVCDLGLQEGRKLGCSWAVSRGESEGQEGNVTGGGHERASKTLDMMSRGAGLEASVAAWARAYPLGRHGDSHEGQGEGELERRHGCCAAGTRL